MRRRRAEFSNGRAEMLQSLTRGLGVLEKAELEARLIREGRMDLAQRLFAFLPTRAELDLMGWDEPNDIFHH